MFEDKETLKTNVLVGLNQPQVQKLNDLSKAMNISRSELIRIMVNDYLYRLDRGEI